MKQIQYTGSSKLINRIVAILNEKTPLPLSGGVPDWGGDGQVLASDGAGSTKWVNQGGGGSGGHTIIDPDGTSMAQEDGLQFGGSVVSVVDDSANNKTIVTVSGDLSDYNNDAGFIDSTDLATALADYTPTASLASVATSGQYSDLSGTPSLATVATSGDYSDLQNKPSIPTVGDGTITIQKNGSTVDTFTTNQSANKTINITVTEGHTIWNRIKTALTSRVALWFADASVSDVSADGATKVEVVTELQSESDFDNLATDGTTDGVYCFPDSGEEYLTADNVGYGSGTVEDALDSVISPTYGTEILITTYPYTLSSNGYLRAIKLTGAYSERYYRLATFGYLSLESSSGNDLRYFTKGVQILSAYGVDLRFIPFA